MSIKLVFGDAFASVELFDPALYLRLGFQTCVSNLDGHGLYLTPKPHDSFVIVADGQAMSRLDPVDQGNRITSKISALSTRSEPGCFERIIGNVTRVPLSFGPNAALFQRSGESVL